MCRVFHAFLADKVKSSNFVGVKAAGCMLRLVIYWDTRPVIKIVRQGKPADLFSRQQRQSPALIFLCTSQRPPHINDHAMDKEMDKDAVIERVLDLLDKERLSDFIRDECSRDEAFYGRFLALGAGTVYAPKAARYSARVAEAIEDYSGRYGFVDYQDAFDLNRDLSRILDEARYGIENGSWDVALAVLVGFSDSAETILYCGDDSAGELGAAVDECFDVWKLFVSQDLPTDVSDTAYDYVMHNYKERVLDGFDWWWEWLRMAAKLASTEQRRSAVFAELDKFKKPEDDERRSEKRDYDKARTLRVQLMADYSPREEFRKYLYDNIDNDNVRCMLLQTAWDDGNLDECLRVAIQGESLDGSHWYECIWKQWQLKVYIEQGDTPNILRLARIAFCGKSFRGVYADSGVMDCSEKAMYSLMKSKVPQAEWAGWVESLIAEPGISDSSLLYLFKKEEMWDRYMQYLSTHATPWLLDDAPAQIRKLYNDEFIRLYAKCVTEYCSQASDRKRYRECVRLLKKLIGYGGLGEASAIVEELKSRTPRRPALIDELSKSGL